MFSGLMSRWTMLRCAALLSAAAICRRMETTRAISSGPLRVTSCLTFGPGTYSCAIKCTPCSQPTS